MDFSVCIVTNRVDDLLFKVLQSALPISDDVLLGTNGLSENEMQQMHSQFPQVRVLDIVWQGYGKTKNLLTAQANHNWVLSLDSDEIISEELHLFLASQALADTGTIYLIKRYNFIGNRKVLYGDYAPEIKARLYHRAHAQWNLDAVHEVLQYPKNSKEMLCDGALWHFTAKNLNAIRQKNDHYAQLGAKKMLLSGRKPSLPKTIISPFFSFVKNYVLKKGFLDGRLGWQLAKEQARYTAKKYQLLSQGKK